MSGRESSGAAKLPGSEVEDGRYGVWAELTRCGDDLSVVVLGGTRPHVGAVALAVSRPSLKNDGAHSASVSVLCLTGHKEDELARLFAKELAVVFRCNVVVTAGVHIDDAAPDEIRRLWDNCLRLLEQLKAQGGCTVT